MAIAHVRSKPTSGTLGVNSNTITTSFDATGCDALVVGFSYGGGGSVAGITVTTATYNGVAMTALCAFVANAGSNNCGCALYGILTPTTGTNNVIITMSASLPSISEITICIVGYSGGSSFGNTATKNDGVSSGNVTMNVTAAAGNMGVAYGGHGSNIDGAGASNTLRDVANNYSTDTSANCGAIVERTGAGTTAMNINSSVSDHWTVHAVELVGTVSVVDYITQEDTFKILLEHVDGALIGENGAGTPLAPRPLTVRQAVQRAAVR